LQGFVAAMMKRPAPDCPAHGLQRRRTRRRHEAVRVASRTIFVLAASSNLVG
jgi:hypothetical protein